MLWGDSKMNLIFKNQKSKLNTEELLYEAKTQKDNNEVINALIYRYKFLINSILRNFYLPGSSKDDLFQEGLIGLYKAIMSFDFNRRASFKYFAKLCIRRHIITCIKNANRGKRSILNNSISLNYKKNYEFDEIKKYIKNNRVSSPEEIILRKETLSNKVLLMENKLTKLENQCYKSYLKGYSYHEIALELDISYSSVNNSIYRAKCKIKSFEEN